MKLDDMKSWNLSSRARRVLDLACIASARGLRLVTRWCLASINGCGDVTANEIERVAREHGVRLATYCCNPGCTYVGASREVVACGYSRKDVVDRLRARAARKGRPKPTPKQRQVPGHVARMITVMIERVSAGDPWRSVVEDYGPWEWNHGPDLSGLAALVELREAVRVWKGARNESENEEARAVDDVLKALRRADRAAGRRAK